MWRNILLLSSSYRPTGTQIENAINLCDSATLYFEKLSLAAVHKLKRKRKQCSTYKHKTETN